MATQIRDTRQKRAIREAFARAGRPLSPDEALAEASKLAAGVSAATIYRNIHALTEDGWLSPVHVPGEPARYEIAGKGHHHHFHCDRCGRVYDLPGDLPGCALASAPSLPKGFRMTGHEVFLYGRCAACR